MSDDPSIFSKQHPTRLNFRAVMLVLVSPVLIYSGVNAMAEDTTRGMLGIGAGLLFALFGGLHLWSVYGRK